MKGKYIGITYPTDKNKFKNEIWIAKGDIVEIIKCNRNVGLYGVNVLNRTCEKSISNRTRFGYDWLINIRDIILFDNNKLDIE